MKNVNSQPLPACRVVRFYGLPLVGGKSRVAKAIEDLDGALGDLYSSDLCGLESRRVIDRLRLESALDDAGIAEAHQELARIEKAIGYIGLTRAVLRRASMPMPTVVKSLDAIHLASALMFQEQRGGPLVFATHDSSQATAAKALGFEVIGAWQESKQPRKTGLPWNDPPDRIRTPIGE